MAIPVARVHLAVAHAALPALLPTLPKWKMLPLLSTPPCPSPCIAAARRHPPKKLAMPSRSRADSGERWDVCKPKPAPASAEPSSSSGRRRSADSVIRSSTGRHGSFPRKNATTSPPPPKPGRADSVARWDAHKKGASPASSSSPSSSGSDTSSSAERWDVHTERRRPPQADQRLDDDGESSSSTGSGNDIGTEEEILWKPRAMYAGPGFVVAAPESSVLPMPTALFLVPVA